MENLNKYYIGAIVILIIIIIVMWIKIKAKNELIDTLAACYDDATHQANEARNRSVKEQPQKQQKFITVPGFVVLV